MADEEELHNLKDDEEDRKIGDQSISWFFSRGLSMNQDQRSEQQLPTNYT